MSESAWPRLSYKVAELPKSRDVSFSLIPDASARAAIAADLDLLGLRKLRFEGTLGDDGKRNWVLSGKLGATVIQACVVSLAPVTTRIDVDVTRRFLAEMPEIDPEESEIEMDEDDSIDPLGSEIDVSAVMVEALALHLPLYPRASDASLGEAVFAEPGTAPMRDEDARPFAGLAALRDQLDTDAEDAKTVEDNQSPKDGKESSE